MKKTLAHTHRLVAWLALTCLCLATAAANPAASFRGNAGSIYHLGFRLARSGW